MGSPLPHASSFGTDPSSIAHAAAQQYHHDEQWFSSLLAESDAHHHHHAGGHGGSRRGGPEDEDPGGDDPELEALLRDSAMAEAPSPSRASPFQGEDYEYDILREFAQKEAGALGGFRRDSHAGSPRVSESNALRGVSLSRGGSPRISDGAALASAGMSGSFGGLSHGAFERELEQHHDAMDDDDAGMTLATSREGIVKSETKAAEYGADPTTTGIHPATLPAHAAAAAAAAAAAGPGIGTSFPAQERAQTQAAHGALGHGSRAASPASRTPGRTPRGPRRRTFAAAN